MRILTFLFLLFSQFTWAQPESLLRDTDKLYEAFDTIDIDALTLMLCTTDPKQTAASLDDWFQNDQTKFRFVNTHAKYTFEKHSQSDTFVIRFRNVVRITFFTKVDAAHEKEKLRKQFAAQSITYDSARNAYLITYTAKMYAIPHHGGWRFAFADSTVPNGLHKGCIGTPNNP